VLRPHIASIHDLQPCAWNAASSSILAAGQMLREVRKDHPALTSWLQVRGQRAQEPAQHATLRVVDPRARWACSGRQETRAGCKPRARPALRKEIRLHDFHSRRQPETLEVLASHVSARGSRSVATTRLMPRRASTAASTPSRCRCRRLGRKTSTRLAEAPWRPDPRIRKRIGAEYSVVRMDSAADRRDFNSLECATRALQ